MHNRYPTVSLGDRAQPDSYFVQFFKGKLFTELFPDRNDEWIPKTLIFAKNDNHAEEIIRIVHEVFRESNTKERKHNS